MSFASRHNHVAPRYAVRISNPAYTSLADLYKENGGDFVYPICGIYINTKGRFGPQACIAINESILVNLPQHLTEVCEDMRADPEDTEAINNGQAGFKVYQYQSKGGRLCYSVTWVDLTR